MTLPELVRPSDGRPHFIGGALLLLLGTGCIVAYAVGLFDAVAEPGSETGVLRGLSTIIAAGSTGAGVLLVAVGLLRRRAGRHRWRTTSSAGIVSRSTAGPG